MSVSDADVNFITELEKELKATARRERERCARVVEMQHAPNHRAYKALLKAATDIRTLGDPDD